MKTFQSSSPSETRIHASEFVKSLGQQAVILLGGDLGAGKTCFVQGMAEGLGWTGPVTSPTYGLVQEFRCSPPLIHADLYRLNTPSQIWDLELDAWLEEEALVAVEWSERVPDFWPADAWHVDLLAIAGEESHREIRIWRREKNV